MFDAIVIGAGPNGLTLACYLAKAGLKVLILEKRHEVGGGLATEDFGGFRFNLHAIYHLLAEIMPPHRDLNLESYGCRYIRPEVQVAFIIDKDRALVFYNDVNKTVKFIHENISGRDAERFRKMYLEFKEFFDNILLPGTYTPPLPPLDLLTQLQKTELGKKFAEISEMSPKDVIEHYGFEDDSLKMSLLYLTCMWAIDPELTGMGFLVPLYVYRMLNNAIIVGGSHRLASALLRFFLDNDGEVLENTEVAKIMIEDNQVKGIETVNGEKYETKVIASSVDIQQTFLRFIGEDKIDSTLARYVKRWEWEEYSYFGLHLGLKKLPNYVISERYPDVNKALVCIFGYSSVDELLDHMKKIRNGELPAPAGHATSITLFDPSQAPTGYHVVRWESLAPYALIKTSWSKEMEEYANEIINTWAEFAPNVNKVNIIRKYAYPPTYIEEKLIDMVKGSVKQGAYIPTQMGYFRPNELCSSYRTPIRGLYLCGACVHPGGGITLGPGYNAAKVIIQDLGIKPWWVEPEFVIKAREKGYLP